MSASSEFISLCRSQVALLTQGLGAALSIVYLTERLIESGTAQDKLIPVVAYPETAGIWEASLRIGALLATKDKDIPRLKELSDSKPDKNYQLYEYGTDTNTRREDNKDRHFLENVSAGAGAVSDHKAGETPVFRSGEPRTVVDGPSIKHPAWGEFTAAENIFQDGVLSAEAQVFNTDAENRIPHESNYSLIPSQQIVLPLMHEGVLMGLLVTSREDRAWNEQERYEIERVAQTLTLARLLDQRRDGLEQKLSQQRRLQAQQRDLLDNLLHQFRNPLTALRTFGKLLLKRMLPGDANRAVADSILRESDRLTQLLQQFDQAIDLTVEAESGAGALGGSADLKHPAWGDFTAGVSPADPQLFKTDDPLKSLPAPPVMEATVEPVPQLTLLASTTNNLCLIADVLKPLVASASAIAEERNLDLLSDIPANLPPVKADANQLREVLSNLIDNALKYTPAPGKVYIQAGLKQDNFQGIAISDTGEGIPPQDLEHLFERYYRGVKAGSEIPGTGLGLAIAKDLIELLQGKIEVFSPAIWHSEASGGSGTTFIVWLIEGLGARD